MGITAHIAHWFFWLTGARNESGTAYGLMSGLLGALPDVMIPAAAAGWYLRGTCHASRWCLRWGRYPAAGGLFTVCRHHHPDLDGQRPHPEMIRRMHRRLP